MNTLATDIPRGNWIDRWTPSAARPYLRLMRLDRPIGTWLLLLPCWWSAALAAEGWPDLRLLLLFGAGALIMRGAGCTFNDFVDREFDSQVARTADRPIASGVVSPFRALLFLGFQLLLGLAILLQFNWYAVIVGTASLALVFTYPFMKRITYWPQAFLGLTFNWGALMGWAAVTGDLAPAALVLYAAGFFWTLGYDTIYAHQDKADDLIVGVKSTALRLGDATRPWLVGFYVVTVVLIAGAGYLVQMGWPFWTALALGALHLAWQARDVDINDPTDCLRKFKSNRDFGLVLFVGIVAGKLIG
ncbi:4-hydroxybenzoate octaprenyltransferase [Magnetospira sp. QH-2]|uniref:4-hydroxybenzoate octaprenyltransferase n=1 Tax=Magnetospira sp. (strain QH-2) TaxID=1288970 RepID=UPI0003E81877|nr:4-hydroxybenzoate octaprenyltransferase [Magnetospira sp. QH-2]CCQ74724.1 putative 4-hydroxybenzoate-octaprenyl transferase [Magnetospira sp. QH-2]